tara:strand:+ start:488 stop:781 length:294 start_codon:yes stop_codon:yes gene_type:complete
MNERTYYYYNMRITNETNPVIIYGVASSIQEISKQLVDLKNLYPEQYKPNDIIKVFTKETEDSNLILFGSYTFKRKRLYKIDNNITPILVTGENTWI